jgi:peptidoglycan/xylan/chitin deacetylase (PgdA/CDA1 family)
VSTLPWPGGARGALSLSFDNLGEAAEIELGAIDPEVPREKHFTVTQVLPGLLDALEGHGLTVTFFIEGLNAELYPSELTEIAKRGHEVSYHAWRHEQWADLSTTEQSDNLARGRAAFRALQLDFAGLRPPGGGLGAGGVEVLREEGGLRYCSPAGEGIGVQGGVALLPFRWQHVDASCVLPPLAPIRERMTGSPDPLDPGAFVAFLRREIDDLERMGGCMTIVLHPFMLDWLGGEQLGELLDRVAEATRSGEIWVAPCADVAEHVLANQAHFGDGTNLDPTSWTYAGD